MSTPSPWLNAVLTHMARTREPLSADQVQRMFGKPAGAGTTVTKLDNACRSGYLRKHDDGIEGRYTATGRLPEHYPATAPSWAAVGRNAPRVASIFHYAQGVQA